MKCVPSSWKRPLQRNPPAFDAKLLSLFTELMQQIRASNASSKPPALSASVYTAESHTMIVCATKNIPRCYMRLHLGIVNANNPQLTLQSIPHLYPKRTHSADTPGRRILLKRPKFSFLCVLTKETFLAAVLLGLSLPNSVYLIRTQ